MANHLPDITEALGSIPGRTIPPPKKKEETNAISHGKIRIHVSCLKVFGEADLIWDFLHSWECLWTCEHASLHHLHSVEIADLKTDLCAPRDGTHDLTLCTVSTFYQLQSQGGLRAPEAQLLGYTSCGQDSKGWWSERWSVFNYTALANCFLICLRYPPS